MGYIRSKFSNEKVKKNRQNSLKVVPNNRSGFTLVELIVAISILAILLAIGLPRVFGFIDSSRITADQATVATLNRLTPLLRMNRLTEDPFKNEVNSSQVLLGELVNDGYLSSKPKPQSKGVEFEWDFGEGKWNLVSGDSYYVIGLSDGLTLNTTGGHIGFLEGSYGGTSKDILIPSSIDGEAITHIYQDVFKDRELTSVKFAENSKVKKIHARAFQNNKLTSIDFPDTLEEIHTNAFENNMFTEIKLPPNLKLIEGHAFKSNKLTKIEFPNTLETIGGYAFEKNMFTEIKLPPNLKTIGIGAFQNNNIIKITIGPSVITFGNNSFGNKTKDFIESYTHATNGGAGTYLLTGDKWIRQ